MKKITNVMIVGVGGQGTVLASDILCAAALLAGHDAKKSEIHGMSQRGGSVFSHVRYGEKIHSPVVTTGEADLLLALEELETLRWLAWASPATAVIVAQNRITPAGMEQYPAGIAAWLQKTFPRCTLLAPEAIAAAAGKPKFANAVLLGAAATVLELPLAAWEQAISESVPAGTAADNLRAFHAGRKLSYI